MSLHRFMAQDAGIRLSNPFTEATRGGIGNVSTRVLPKVVAIAASRLADHRR